MLPGFRRVNDSARPIRRDSDELSGGSVEQNATQGVTGPSVRTEVHASVIDRSATDVAWQDDTVRGLPTGPTFSHVGAPVSVQTAPSTGDESALFARTTVATGVHAQRDAARKAMEEGKRRSVEVQDDEEDAARKRSRRLDDSASVLASIGQRGAWANQVGDIAPVALANVTGRPIQIVDLEGRPLTEIDTALDGSQLRGNAIFLQRDPAGHYLASNDGGRSYVDMPKNGDCLFHGILFAQATQEYRSGAQVQQLRTQTQAWMVRNRQALQDFLVQDYAEPPVSRTMPGAVYSSIAQFKEASDPLSAAQGWLSYPGGGTGDIWHSAAASVLRTDMGVLFAFDPRATKPKGRGQPSGKSKSARKFPSMMSYLAQLGGRTVASAVLSKSKKKESAMPNKLAGIGERMIQESGKDLSESAGRNHRHSG